MRWVALLLLLSACGGRRSASDLPDAPEEDLRGDPEDLPEGEVPVGPPGAAPRLRPPLPDGWPREPIEPLPLAGTTRTVLDHADPVARFVADIHAPGQLALEVKVAKATAFKARVVVYDSLGETLAETTFTESWRLEPHDLLPGALYLLVERRAGAGELVVKSSFSGEAAPEE